MKKLGKLSINPEKLMKNEELVSLRGGYEGMAVCVCTDSTGVIGNIILPVLCSTKDCTTECNSVFGGGYSQGTIVGLCSPGY